MHTIAVLKGHEQYENMRDGLAPVLDEINSLIETEIVAVKGQTIQLKFMFGGDYKVISGS